MLHCPETSPGDWTEYIYIFYKIDMTAGKSRNLVFQTLSATLNILPITFYYRRSRIQIVLPLFSTHALASLILLLPKNFLLHSRRYLVNLFQNGGDLLYSFRLLFACLGYFI